MEEVVIYTSATCGYCQKAKAFLNENGVPYTEMHVDTDSLALKAYNTLGVQGVPVIVYGKEKIIGFDRERLEALFGKLIIECPECRKKLRLPKNKGVLEVNCPQCSAVFRVNTTR